MTNRSPSPSPLSASSWLRRVRFPARRGRRGLSLMEVMVAVAILLALAVVLVPAMGQLFSVQHRRAAKRMVLLYQRLHDEAVLRNVTFRVVFDLDSNKTSIDVGEPGAVIYTDPEQRLHYEEETRRKLAAMDEEEKQDWLRKRQPFEKLNANFKSDFELPRGLVLGGVYTPQYGDMITREDLPKEEEEGRRQLYSYVFANGLSEHTVIWLVEERNPDDGWTIVVEPLSGKVELLPELVPWQDTVADIPTEGPDLPN